MSTSTTYAPLAIRVKGSIRQWVPELSSYIGNFQIAAERAASLRKEHRRLGTGVTIRRFGCCVNAYR